MAWGGMACSIDTETGAARWESGRIPGGVADLVDLVGAVDLTDGPADASLGLTLPNGGASSHLASYSTSS